MEEEIGFEKCNFRNFASPVTVTLDWVIHASLIDLYVHTKFHWNWKNFVVAELSAGTPPEFKVSSLDTKTRTNIKNPTGSNLDIVL